jgi:hypothetical protein
MGKAQTQVKYEAERVVIIEDSQIGRAAKSAKADGTAMEVRQWADSCGKSMFFPPRAFNVIRITKAHAREAMVQLPFSVPLSSALPKFTKRRKLKFLLQNHNI